MIIEVNKYEMHFCGTIKKGKYTTIHSLDIERGFDFFTKIITLNTQNQKEFIQAELKDRNRIIASIHKANQLSTFDTRYLDAKQVKGKYYDTLYLSSPFIQGWNLGQFLAKREDLCELKQSFFIETTKEILNILMQSFNNLIVTHQNLLLQVTTQGKFKVKVNYLSFVGQKFLKFKEPISRQQYSQIALFLDEEAIETGNLDRFQFKLRNFCCLMLFFIIQKNPYNYIFHNVHVQQVINKTSAIHLHKNTVIPGINNILKSDGFKKKVKAVKIQNLQEILWDSFNSRDILNWTTVLHRIQFLSGANLPIFSQMSKVLWENQDIFTQQVMIKKGLEHQDGTQLYLYLKLGVLVENFILQNNMCDILFSRQSLSLFKRFLSLYKLKNSLINELLTKNIPEAFKDVLRHLELVSKQFDIVSQYPRPSE